MLEPAWISAREFRRRLSEAGLASSALAKAVAYACAWRDVHASGFGYLHIADKPAAENGERERVNKRIWHGILKEGEKQALIDPNDDEQWIEVERPLTCYVDWENGRFSYRIERDGQDTIEEIWTSVHFDRVAVETVVWEIKARATAEALQDWEIDAWIATECRATDKAEAWKQLTADHGTSRRGKKSVFDLRWAECTGHRPRGRPRKTAKP